MSSEEIQLYINNRKVGARILVGSQPKMSFFEQLKSHLIGECTITFHVGHQKVENKITLNRTEFKVENNFTPLNIQSFVDQQKKRISREQQDANFSDETTEIYFVPARTLLACKEVFPVFDRTQLVKDPQGSKFFVSHPWQTKEHPDPQGMHLSLIQQFARRQEQDAFYWIDYSCLPQKPRSAEDEDLFKRTLPKISSVQSECSTVVIANENYTKRMWCYIENFAGILFSQAQNRSDIHRSIEYIGSQYPHTSMANKVQTLEEPPWDELMITDASDIVGLKYNFKWLTNLVKFQLFDRFMELLATLPGHEVYSGYHYPQSAFGINYSNTLEKLRDLFFTFGGTVEHFYKEGSLPWLARRFSWSVYPNDYKIEDLRFPQALFHSENMVGWIALLLAIIKTLNLENDEIINLRDLYAKILLMSLYS